MTDARRFEERRAVLQEQVRARRRANRSAVAIVMGLLFGGGAGVWGAQRFLGYLIEDARFFGREGGIFVVFVAPALWVLGAVVGGAVGGLLFWGLSRLRRVK